MKRYILCGLIIGTAACSGVAAIAMSDGDRCADGDLCKSKKPLCALSLEEQVKKGAAIFKVQVKNIKPSERAGDYCLYDVQIGQKLSGSTEVASSDFKIVDESPFVKQTFCRAIGSEFFVIMEKRAFDYDLKKNCRYSSIVDASKQNEILKFIAYKE